MDVVVNPDVLGNKNLDLPGGIQVSFSNNIAGDENAYHYVSKYADAIITFNPKSESMHGHAMLTTGKSFTLENCGVGKHVWKEIDTEVLGGNDGVDYVPYIGNLGTEVFDRKEKRRLVKQAHADNTTMVSYSVAFYITPDFAAATPDPVGFINQVIMETNQGYANSLVPLTVTMHCVVLADINDESSASSMLSSFANMKPTAAELRSGADKIAETLGLDISFEQAGALDPVEFDPSCVRNVREAAIGLGYSHMNLVSGAGHDAFWMSKAAPTAMVMCPCVDGLSHNEAEEISQEWAAASTNVLFHAVVETAGLIDE